MEPNIFKRYATDKAKAEGGVLSAQRIREGVDMNNLHPGVSGLLSKLAAANVVPSFEVTSGFRDPIRNASAGGAKGSQHIHGKAVDISTNGWDDTQRSAFLAEAIKNGAKGVGVYPNGSLHFDVRDTPAAWGPKGYNGSPIETYPEWARSHIQGLLGSSATTPAVMPNAAPGAMADAGISPLPKPSAGAAFGVGGPVDTSVPAPAVTPTPDAAPAGGLLDKDWEKGLAGIAKAFGGGQQSQQQSTPMPGLSNFGAEQAARVAPAQALMTQLLASKTKMRGLV